MKVILSAAARKDLDEIHDYICVRSIARADAFIAELLRASHTIADTPLAFPLVPRAENHSLRRKRHRRYLIFYVAAESSVEIIRVLHGVRDYERVLFPDDEQP